MTTNEWEVAPFGRDFMGNPNGFVVRRGYGFGLEIAKTFPACGFREGALEKAFTLAMRLTLQLNGEERP